MLDRILGRLNGPHGPLLLAVFAVLLSLPALRLGFQADDHVFRAAHARGAPAWKMINLSAAGLVEQRERGYWSWWTSPRLEIDFHVEARLFRSQWLQASSVACAILALLSGEAGTWSLAYLLAYALPPGVGQRALLIGSNMLSGLPR